MSVLIHWPFRECLASIVIEQMTEMNTVELSKYNFESDRQSKL